MRREREREREREEEREERKDGRGRDGDDEGRAPGRGVGKRLNDRTDGEKKKKRKDPPGPALEDPPDHLERGFHFVFADGAPPGLALLLPLKLTSLIMFSTMSSAGHHGDTARQYVVAIGVIMWLLTSALAASYLLTLQHDLPTIHLDHQGPVLQITGKLSIELVYYALFSFLSLVAFFCAAVHAHGSGAAAASAFFGVVLAAATGASCVLTYRDLADDLSGGPQLNPGQPASVSQPSQF